MLSEDLQEYVLAMEVLVDEVIPTTQLQHQTTEDRILHQVKRWIPKGWSNDQHEVDQQLRLDYNRKDEPTVVYGLVYWGQRVVIPETAWETMLKLLPDAHRGTSRMKAPARTLL